MLVRLLKKYLHLVLCVFLFSCFTPPETDMRDNEYEYNPQKAGAEISHRVIVPSGNYLTYTNHHHYLLTKNKITVFDLSDDDVIIKNEITYNIHSIFPNDGDITYSADRPVALFEIDNKIYFKVVIYKKRYIGSNSVKYLGSDSPIFSINTNGTNFMLSDLTVDLDYNDSIKNIRYDTKTCCLYTAVYNNSMSYDIYQYQYNIDTLHFDNPVKYAEVSGHQIEDFYMSDKYCIAAYYECIIPQRWYTNEIYIHNGFQSSYRKIDLVYLHLYNRPLSAFSDDDGNIWLYVREPSQGSDGHLRRTDAAVADDLCDKYELLKLKLLE